MIPRRNLKPYEINAIRWAQSVRSSPAQERPQGRIFKGKQREHAIEQAQVLLSRWQSSYFQYEGATRAGIRSGLCLAGYGWAKADQEAASLVEAALHRMGARRPTWEEGQRGYVEPRENCINCGGLIPEELLLGGRAPRFCSTPCARTALSHSEIKVRSSMDRVYREAIVAITKTRLPARPCAHCGRGFKSTMARQIYCSQTCAGAAGRTVPERACAHCGKVFRPHHNTQEHNPGIFCSKACTDAHRRPMTCACCGTEFMGHANNRYCSETCSKFVYKVKAGKRLNMTPRVFDCIYVFARAALASRSRCG